MHAETPIVPPYKVGDLARLLDCSTQHVRALFHAGKVPGGFRLGRIVRFDRRQVDEWLHQMKQAAGTAK